MSRYTDVEQISREEYQQLLGLKVLADRHQAALDEITRAMASITGERSDHGDLGHTSDCAVGNLDVDQLLRKLEIQIDL